jgi:HD-like signal output (HDOD) protein
MSEEPNWPGQMLGTELRAKLSRELRESLIDKALSLPLGSQAALAQVAYLCQLRGTSISKIAHAAAADASFAATLLRIANSAASAPRWQVADLSTAVTRLGTRMVGTLAVAAPTLRLLSAPDDGLAGVRREIHRHSIRVGALARELAPPSIHRETALAAGLVHNVGLGVLSLYATVGLRRVLEAASEDVPLAAVEPDVFGFTHAELGGMLARAWKYPEFLVVAIEDHDREDPPSPLAALIQVSDLLVRQSGIGVEPPAEISIGAAKNARLVLQDVRAKAAAVLGPSSDPDADADDAMARAGDVSGAKLIETLEELGVAV